MPTAGSKAAESTITHHDPIGVILAAVSAQVGAVRKDSKAPGVMGGYSFRGVDAVVNAVHPVLTSYGVTITPEVLDVERVTTQSAKGASMLNVYVRTRFTFHGPLGDELSTTVLGEAADAGDKATSKAQSVALRVALLQVLLLPTDEPDTEAGDYQRGGREQVTSQGNGRRDEHHGAARAREQESQERERPAHLHHWDSAWDALSTSQQGWVKDNWPDGIPAPAYMTVAQAAQQVEWLAANCPPA